MKKPSKIDAEIDGKVIRFRKSRFLVFCEEYNVKIVFSHDEEGRKCMKNPSKIEARSETEKNMPKSCKHHQKRTPECIKNL